MLLNMKLEVMNMSYEFLLGRDVLPKLFPNDEIMTYFPTHFEMVDSQLVPTKPPPADMAIHYAINNVDIDDIESNKIVGDYLSYRDHVQTINRIISDINGNINVSAISAPSQ